MTILYGIKNCDTVKKARRWLDQNQVDYRFHDFRTDGLEKPTVERWLKALGAETLVNKRSTTWKQLNDKDKQVAQSSAAAELLLAHPTLIKRPLLEAQGQLQSGFSETAYSEIFL